MAQTLIRRARVRRPRRSGTTMIAASRMVAPSTKAAMHMGEGRVRRRFFDVSDADLDAIVARVSDGIAETLATTERS